MAVQQNKKSPSKRGMHRSHNALGVPGIAVEPTQRLSDSGGGVGEKPQ
jgi:ribosomal protein L32